ncbi:MAG: ATP-binding protein [Candidatus Binatia bacterium]
MLHQAPSDAATSGVGLGLYIVRRFIELLGGRVSASSRQGEGSIFRLSLPAGVGDAGAAGVDRGAAAAAARAGVGG